MKRNFFKIISNMFVIWLLIAVQACDNGPTPEVPIGADGYFIVNEGGFNKSTTSISFFDRASSTVTNDLFAAKNGRPLGDQSQSLTVFEGKAYVMVQHSGKVEVINADDYSSVKTIDDQIESPRFFIGVSSTKGYVSDWGADGTTGTVKVIDLNELKVTKTIPTGQGANKMIMKDGKVYVANNGGFGKDTKVTIIDTSKDEVSSTITVGDNPTALQFDKDGNLWVVNGGAIVYNETFTAIDEAKSTKPSLSKIGTDNKEALRLTFANLNYGELGQLEINNAGDKLFFIYDRAVYAMSTSATALPTAKFINKSFYGLAVDPFNDDVIGTEALDYSTPGKVYVYDAAGTLQTTLTVGIAPNGVGFK